MQSTFIVNQKELLLLLGAMQPICNKRTALDVTESILFSLTPRELTLKATDLEISVQSHMAIEGDFVDSKTFLISGKRIYELVRELDDQVTFVVDNESLHVKSGGVDLVLNIKDASQVPPFPELIENLMDLDNQLFLNLLNKVAFLIPSNNANAALNGLLLELSPDHLALVATDGHCLAHVTTAAYTLPTPRSWLLPKRAVLEIKKLLETNQSAPLFLGTCGNQLVFSGKNFNFFTRLIADQFPNYRPVMQHEGFTPARIARDPFVRTLKRATCMLAGQFLSTQFTFAPAHLGVKLHNKEVGKLEEQVPMDGFDEAPIESRFYAPYLLNGLQAFNGDQLSCFVKSSTKPLMFQAQDEKTVLTYVVMPVSQATPNS